MMVFGVEEYILALIAISIAFYYRSISKLKYWKERGVPGPKTVPFLGNFTQVFFKQTSTVERIQKIYEEWKNEPFVGFYKGETPELLINDLDLIKRVLITDFSYFPGRGLGVNKDVDPLSDNLFRMDGLRWKTLRAKLTPIFTTGKLKHMVELMAECADHFELCLKRKVGEGSVIDCRDVARQFTIDVIGSCAFGINMNALAQEDSDFNKYGRKLSESNFENMMKRLIADISPALFKFLQLRSFSKEGSDFFIRSIKETFQMRGREGIIRKDLIDLLINIKKTHDNEGFEYSDELMAAQAFVFFLAGFDTSSGTIGFLLYELSRTPEIQEKLREEILENLKKNHGESTYDVLTNMKYLDMVIKETLRLNPIIGVLERRVNEAYKIPGTSVTLEKGMKINILVHGIHMDPEYFPNPEKFDPERFSAEIVAQRHPMAHLPFGDGPKNCIGLRFANLQVKLGIIKILKNFRIKPSESTVYPYVVDKGNFFLSPQDGINLEFEPLT